MRLHAIGTVTALEYHNRPAMSFADIVEEFDIAFHLIDASKRSLVWDCDDIAVIDRDNLRIALGWLAPVVPGASWYLIIAVGPNPTIQGKQISEESLEYIEHGLVERTCEFLPADATLRGQAGQPVSADLIDTTLELLRQTTAANCDDTYRNTRHVVAEDLSDVMPPWMGADALSTELDEEHTSSGEHKDWAPKPKQCEHRNKPFALLERAEPTQPLRLTIHTLAATLLLHIPALGAFLIVYSLLRDVYPLTT